VWDFENSCATSYSVKFDESYPKAMIALQIKSDDTVSLFGAISVQNSSNIPD
jgi:hypothetical protein